jgi:hypothetical protein
MKKKSILMVLAIAGLSLLMSSCGAGVSATVDPKVLENKEEVQKIYDSVLQAMGAQASKADEVRIMVDNPADKGKTGDTYLTLIMDYQDPNKPKQLLRQMFHGELGRWQPTQEVTVQVSGDDVENFRLEDELFDFTKFDAEKIYNLIQTAYNKDNANPEKYTYRYVSQIVFDTEGINVNIKGKLEANDQMVTDYVDFDLEGNLQE